MIPVSVKLGLWLLVCRTFGYNNLDIRLISDVICGAHGRIRNRRVFRTEHTCDTRLLEEFRFYNKNNLRLRVTGRAALRHCRPEVRPMRLHSSVRDKLLHRIKHSPCMFNGQHIISHILIFIYKKTQATGLPSFNKSLRHQ